MMFEGKHNDLTEKVIGAFFKVNNQLGYGFSEKIYENAMVFEIKKLGIEIGQQSPIHVYYENYLLGEFFADLIVNGLVIVEVKSVRHLVEEHEAQLLRFPKSHTN